MTRVGSQRHSKKKKKKPLVVCLQITCLLKFPICMCGTLNGAISCLELTIHCRVAE